MVAFPLRFRSKAGKLSRRWRLILGGLGVGVSAGLLLLTFTFLPAGTALELRALDLLFLLRGPLPPPESIVIVAIDDNVPPVSNLRWPWPRRYHARLLDRVRTAGARVIAFDLIFDQPSSEEDDAAFERALIRAGNVVVASDLAFRETEEVREAYSVEPIRRFAAVVRSVGTVAIPTDPDHYLRSARFTFLRRPSFALEVARVALPEGAVELAASGERLIIDGNEVPVRRPGQMLINYVGPAQTVTTVPFGEALTMGEARARQMFQDRIVLIGRAPLSIINLRKLAPDTFATPFLHTSESYLPGIEVHANILATMLDRRFIAPVAWGSHAMLCLLWGALLSLAIIGVRPFTGALFGLAAMPIPLWAAYRLFAADRLWLPWAGLTLEVIVVYGGVLLVRYLVTERDRAFLRRAFQYYVHPAVIEKIVADPDALKLGGDTVYGTVSFADLKGFTTISEHLTPETLVSFLNEFLTAGTDIVMQRQGMVSRYIGDAIMAVWGAPLPVVHHARLACEAAMELQREVHKRNPEWTARGLPKLQVRVGVNTGQMVTGNVGSLERFDYTAMGDTVNLASRLEGLCKNYGIGILMSETTRKEVEIPVREIDLVRVVGKGQAIRVYQPLEAGADLELVRLFEQGLAAYRSREFTQALEQFERVLQRDADDEPARVYRDRCQLMIHEPPPPDWDGVFEPKGK